MGYFGFSVTLLGETQASDKDGERTQRNCGGGRQHTRGNKKM